RGIHGQAPRTTSRPDSGCHSRRARVIVQQAPAARDDSHAAIYTTRRDATSFQVKGATVASVVGAAGAPIATLVGAVFRMKQGTDAGAAGKAEVEQRRSEVQNVAVTLAAQMGPEM